MLLISAVDIKYQELQSHAQVLEGVPEICQTMSIRVDLPLRIDADLDVDDGERFHCFRNELSSSLQSSRIGVQDCLIR